MNLHWLKLILRWIKSKWDILLWIAPLLLLICLFIILQSWEINPKPIDEKVRVVVAVDSLSKSVESKDILAHNKLVINILQSREASCANDGVSHVNNLNQSRTIYVVLISVLLAFILKEKKNKIFVIILILFVIVGMYAVEVHVQDLQARQKGSCSIMHKSVNFLVNSNSIDSIWYGLNYDKYTAQDSVASSSSKKRKISSAYDPDLEQIGYYWFPCGLIYFYLLWPIFRKKKGE